MNAKLNAVVNDFEKTAKQMLDKANNAALLSRVVYPVYQRLQTERFKTENQSEGSSWPSLNRAYKTYKAKRWRSFPGSGNKMLIATSTLAGAVIGRGDHPFLGTDRHKALFKSKSMTIMVSLTGTVPVPPAIGKRKAKATSRPFNYAGYVNEKRPFMKFSDQSIQEMRDAILEYLAK